MTIELEEFEPGRWRVKKARHEKQRAENMPLPFVISDIMPPTEQVDGKFYTSKSAFRKVGRSLGLTEVGNEKPKPRVRLSQTRAAAEGRRASIKKAIEMVRAGNINQQSRSRRP
jgi:hypothetical protein